jgi:pimeloyl-ACP methyl ester carboxylesterase
MTTPLVVLVHGAWHGAWGWAALQAELDARSIPSLAVDLPGHGASTADLTDLPGDAAAVAAVIRRHVRRQGGPVVLVGHSYGGAVITQVAAEPDITPHVRHLVYVAAYALQADESILDVILALPLVTTVLAEAIISHDDGTTTIDPDRAVPAFYADCPPAAAAAAIARLDHQSGTSFGQKVTGSPLGSVPSTYVRCTADQAVPVSQQDHMAVRCDHVVTFDTDHSPFLGRPAEMADVIARTV